MFSEHSQTEIGRVSGTHTILVESTFNRLFELLFCQLRKMADDPLFRTVVAGGALVVGVRRVQEVKLLLESLQWLCTSQGHKIVPFHPDADAAAQVHVKRNENLFPAANAAAAGKSVKKTQFRLLPLTAGATAVILETIVDGPAQKGGEVGGATTDGGGGISISGAAGGVGAAPHWSSHRPRQKGVGTELRPAAIAALKELMQTDVARFIPSERLPPPPLPRRERPGAKGSKKAKRKRTAEAEAEGEGATKKRGTMLTAASAAGSPSLGNSTGALLPGAESKSTFGMEGVAAGAGVGVLQNIKRTFTFVELFAGVGGFRIGMEAVGGDCVFASELDPQARETYMLNFGGGSNDDVSSDGS